MKTLNRLILSSFAFLGLIGPLLGEEDESKSPIPKDLIVGVWLAHNFDGPGSDPRIELKKGGKFRAKFQNDEEATGKWEWRDGEVIALIFPDAGKEKTSKITTLSDTKMVMTSPRGRDTIYVRLKSWTSKPPEDKPE